MADALFLISVISFAAAGVFLVIAMALFLIFKIPVVFGDLSGRTAKKSIESMRKNNERTGNKSYSSSSVNMARGKLTENITGSDRKKTEIIRQNGETGLLNENQAIDYQRIDTEILETTTEVLRDENATTPLEDVQSVCGRKKESSMKFTMIEEVIFIHTEEVIM